MPDISITVADKIAQVQGNPVIVCGNSDYVVRFTFDSEWDAYTTKTAVFRYYYNGTIKEYEVLFSGDTVKIPTLPTIFMLSVDVSAGDLKTSLAASIRCSGESIYHAPPNESVYNQLLEYLKNYGKGGGTNVAVARLRLRGTAETIIGVIDAVNGFATTISGVAETV